MDENKYDIFSKILDFLEEKIESLDEIDDDSEECEEIRELVHLLYTKLEVILN